MKYIISFFLFLKSMSSIGQTYDIVLIKHIGESDKPLPTLIIYSKGMCDNACVQSILALNKSDAFLKRVITGTNFTNIFRDALEDTASIEPKEKAYIFGSFKITFYQGIDCKKQSAFILDREKGIAFFNTVAKKIRNRKSEKDNELIAPLENIIKRINY